MTYSCAKHRFGVQVAKFKKKIWIVEAVVPQGAGGSSPCEYVIWRKCQFVLTSSVC